MLMTIGKVAICILSALIIVLVLMQKPKEPGMGASFGGSDTFLSKTKSKTYEAKLDRYTKIAAVLLAIRNRPLTTLRADPPGLRKVAPTVFAALDRWAHRRYNSVLPVPAALVPR